MEISRLIFTKETKEKMEKPINKFKKGELRWQRLKELDNEGKLAKATSRKDVAKMLGATKDYGAEYCWVSSMISGGHLTETLTGFNNDLHRAEYEYHVTNKQPIYDSGVIAAKAKEGKEKKAKTQVISSNLKPAPEKVLAVPTNDGGKMIIRYKDLVIELENISQATIESIIDRLADRQ